LVFSFLCDDQRSMHSSLDYVDSCREIHAYILAFFHANSYDDPLSDVRETQPITREQIIVHFVIYFQTRTYQKSVSCCVYKFHLVYNGAFCFRVELHLSCVGTFGSLVVFLFHPEASSKRGKS